MFNIQCDVWGGVTGHRTSLLKDCGVVLTFGTLEAAEEEAARRTKFMNGGYGSASFDYKAIPAQGAEQ